MQIIRADTGEILFDGEAVGTHALDLVAYRREVQMVFQDSYASLNPRLTVEETVAFGPRVHGLSRRAAIARAHDLISRVGLDPKRFAAPYPHELAAGQRQPAVTDRSAKRFRLLYALQIRGAGVRGDRTVSGRDRPGASRCLLVGNAGVRTSAGRADRMSAEPIVDVEGLTVDFLGGAKPL